LSGGLPLPSRPRLTDLLRPSRLYAAIDASPTFIIPVLLLALCATVYVQVAFGRAFPLIAQDLITRSTVTESELVRNFRLMLGFASTLLPMFVTFGVAVTAWLALVVCRAARPFPLVTSLFAWASVWLALGFLAKTALVLATGAPDPATNLGLLFPARTPFARGLLALTNPFVLLAAIWAARGLGAWGVGVVGRVAGGAAPWLVLAAALAVGSGGAERFAPEGPVDFTGYSTAVEGPITLRYPPRAKRQEGEYVARAVAGVVESMANRVGFEARPLTIVAYPSHEVLEHATGEFLHVQVVASIRGKDLLYVEMPGYSAAVPAEQGLREVMRWALVMELAPVLNDAPRWFVHGVAHARVYPAGPELDARYRAILRRIGPPSYDGVMNPMLFRTPDGPVLARSLVDHLAFFYGIDAVEGIVTDLRDGMSFRDALFARTRLTASALEAGWQDHGRALLSVDSLADSLGTSPPDPVPAPDQGAEP
jgi:hypothetical protein